MKVTRKSKKLILMNDLWLRIGDSGRWNIYVYISLPVGIPLPFPVPRYDSLFSRFHSHISPTILAGILISAHLVGLRAGCEVGYPLFVY